MRKKFTTVFITLVMAVALIVTGTFAWVNFTQAMKNEFEGGENTPGGTTHDDFDEDGDGDGHYNKDVYVENWGQRNIYVRIRLDEYMEIGEGAGLKAKLLDNILTPDPANVSKSLMPGADINDTSTWSTHIPDGVPELCDTTADFHDYWEWIMGGSKYYMPAPDDMKTDPAYVDQNTNIYDALTPGADTTLDATVITMEEWIALGSPVGENYWVIDTDGWAYWAAPLKPGDATGLLLDQVNRLKDIEDSYYYAINVVVQMASKFGDLNYTDFYSDPNDKDHSATDDGKELLKKITDQDKEQVKATKVTINGGDKELSIGQTYKPGCVIEPANSTDKPVWSSSDDAIATVDANGKITGVSEGEATITVTVGDKTDSITVTVKPATAPVIPTKLGEGPYDTQVHNTVIESNYALVTKAKASTFNADDMREPIEQGADGYQYGSIKLSAIFGTNSYTGVTVAAENATLSQYFHFGTDKDGDDALIYSYIPTKGVWDAAVPATPVETINLILSKTGYQDTLIKVIVRYNMSIYADQN